MPSILSEYEYDIFISYRQNDNKRDGWVTEFIKTLQDELEATVKDKINIYFDENPLDGLGETHDVDDSLAKKLKCLIFIPVISKTYCDPNCFAWTSEFLAFNELAKNDKYGIKVSLLNGNTASRVLPIRIHDISLEDKKLVEDEIGFLRSIDFVYQEAGVNRPLKPDDRKEDNLNKTNYRNQINKVANAIQDIISGLKKANSSNPNELQEEERPSAHPQKKNIGGELKQRSVLRASLVYILAALALWKITDISSELLNLTERTTQFITLSLIIVFPIAMLMAWLYERSPQGFVRAGSRASQDNPFTDAQKKPLTSNTFIILLLATVVGLFVIFPSGVPRGGSGVSASEVSIGIIPFRNNTGDKELNHYGVGLASEVRTELSLSKQFDFISSLQATIKYQNSDDDPQQIGNELGVTHIVSGMYQMAGTDMRVIVEMVEAATGKIIWSLPYNTHYDNLFSLQAEIAEMVMKKFAVKKNEKRAVPTRNMEAFASLTKGRAISSSSNIPKTRAKAIPYYKQAIALDSGYLEAWSGLIQEMSYYYSNHRDTVYTPEMIKPYYDYVEEHFPESWKKNEVRGIYTYSLKGDYKGGLIYFEDVLDENPFSSTALSYIGAIYRRTLQLEKAIENSILMVKTAPENITNWNELAFVFRDNGDFKNAEKARLKMYELDNQNYIQLYNLKRLTNSLDELPGYVKNDMGYTFRADLYRQRRNFIGLNTFLDTLRLDTVFSSSSRAYYKAINYYNLKENDSSKYYANRYLNMEAYDVGSFGVFNRKYTMFSILGREDDATQLWDAYIELQDEDLILQFSIKSYKVGYMAFNDQYQEAEDLLKSMNEDYSEMGDYAWLNLPFFDRIKAEYPPFAEAVANLKLPPLLVEDNQLERLNY